MSWSITYTAHAKQDLRDIYAYIANHLQVPETASNQIRRIMAAIRKLNEMPFRFSSYKDEPWFSRGLRFVPVDNYLVFYIPDENSGTISITRIMYSGRDISKQLNEEQ